MDSAFAEKFVWCGNTRVMGAVSPFIFEWPLWVFATDLPAPIFLETMDCWDQAMADDDDDDGGAAEATRGSGGRSTAHTRHHGGGRGRGRGRGREPGDEPGRKRASWADATAATAAAAAGGGVGGGGGGGEADDAFGMLGASAAKRTRRSGFGSDDADADAGAGAGAFEDFDADGDAESAAEAAGVKRIKYTVTMRKKRLCDTAGQEDGGAAGPRAQVIEADELRARFMRQEENKKCVLCREGFMLDASEEDAEVDIKLRGFVEELLAWGEDLQSLYEFVVKFRAQNMPARPQCTAAEVEHHLAQCIRVIDVMVERDIQTLEATGSAALGTTWRGEWETRAGSHHWIGAYITCMKMRYSLLQVDRNKLRARVRGRLGGAAPSARR